MKKTVSSKATGTVEVEFEFQELPLEQARTLIAAGGGKYSALCEGVLSRLPTLESEGKTCVFGLPGGRELAEPERRGLCIAVSAALRRAGLGFRCTYSFERKLFVVLPHRAGHASKPNAASKPSKMPLVLRAEQLCDYVEKTFGVSVKKLAAGAKGDRAVDAARGAMVAVAPSYGLRINAIAPMVGESPDNAYYLRKIAAERYGPEIARLRETIARDGVA